MGFEKTIPPAFKHQAATTGFITGNDYVYVGNDPGTGKTRSCLDAIETRLNNNEIRRTLVVAPKSILAASWLEDAQQFTPNLKCDIAWAKNREDAFKSDADVVITNHDAAKWLAENSKLLKEQGFDNFIGDEWTAYKHRTSQRSKAMNAIMDIFKFRVGMSGTMTPNGITDIWHQILLLDRGAHLGNNYWKFQNTVCTPVQVGRAPNAVRWEEKPGAKEAVIDLLSDMVIRYRLEDCIDMPDHSIQHITYTPPAALMKHYEQMRKQAVLEVGNTVVNAVHAASLRTKLLQVASGAVYDEAHKSFALCKSRYELVLDLAEAREQCVIAFVWTHQKEGLIKEATKRKRSFAVIDGTVNDSDRLLAVKQFQAGEIDYIFAHPQSAGHGLTLTRGTTTIWPSPIDNTEHFEQFNRRIYRAGQTRKTETLLVTAEGTLEESVYENTLGKRDDMNNLMQLLEAA